METWNQGLGLQLTGFGHSANDYEVFNNNVHFGRGDKESYIMAIELGKPADVTGQPFTSVFASHDGNTISARKMSFHPPEPTLNSQFFPLHQP